MHIAYLVNQYPAVSHSFIRREIDALERLGATVSRFSVRDMSDQPLPDPRDQAELGRTTALLGDGSKALLGPLARIARRRPAAFKRALALTVTTGRRSERGLAINFAYLGEACLLVEQLEAAGVDHVHAHFGSNSTTVAMLAHELGGPSFSFTAHGPEEFDKPDLIALAAKIDRAAFVVGVSEFGRSQLCRYTPADKWSRVHIVHCGLDPADLADEPTPVPDVTQFCSVGRLVEQKGQLVLIEAVGMLRREGRDVSMVIIGDGDMRPEVEALIASEQVGDCVRLAGWASSDVVRAELEAARAFVLPSFAEGLPVVLMEALAQGRPVITTFIAGIPELVETGVDGWIVPAGSATAVADAMRAALDADVAELSEMGRRGLDRVRAHHNADTEAAVLLGLFERYVDAA